MPTTLQILTVTSVLILLMTLWGLFIGGTLKESFFTALGFWGLAAGGYLGMIARFSMH